MSDLLLFVSGTIVTLMVGSSVGLLLYGAAREPRGKGKRVEFEQNRFDSPAIHSPSRQRRGPSARSHRAARSWTRSF